MANKVFVDLDDEIVFVVEKVLNSEDNQLILVVPESANLVSSLVSLKLLARQINKSKKLAVLVTEDKLGLELAEEAGLVAVEKISEVTGQIWKRALLLKEEFLNARESLKQKLVRQREEGEKVVFEETPEKDTEMASDEAVEEAEETAESEEEVEGKEAQAEEDEEFFQGMPEKPRLKGKLIDAGGFSMVAGGDIAEDLDVLTNEVGQENYGQDEIQEQNEPVREEIRKMPKVKEEVEENPGEEGQDSYEEEPDPEPKNKVIDHRATSFLGKDLASSEAKPQKKSRIVAAGDGVGILDKVKRFFAQDKKRLYVLVGALLLIGLFLVGYFVLPKVSIEITLAEAEVPVSKDVKASTAVTEVDHEGQIIPAKKIELTKSSSGSASATGKGQSGDKAEGVMTFYNSTDKEVKLPANTPVYQPTDPSIKYFLKSGVTIPTVSGGIGVLDDVVVVAETFGEKYNWNPSGDGDYKVGTYSLAEVNAKTFKQVNVKGTTKEVTEISDDDFNNLKNKLVEELKKSILAELATQVKEDEVMIEGTETTGEPKVTPSHNIGDDFESVDMTVEIIASAFVVEQDDLKDIANYLVTQQKEIEGEIEVKDLDEVEVSNGVVSGDTATFKLKVKGSVKASVDEESIKDAIRGKEYSQAAGIIRDLPDVEKYKINYSPSWMPIKRMPDSDENIEVIIK